MCRGALSASSVQVDILLRCLPLLFPRRIVASCTRSPRSRCRATLGVESPGPRRRLVRRLRWRVSLSGRLNLTATTVYTSGMTLESRGSVSQAAVWHVINGKRRSRGSSGDLRNIQTKKRKNKREKKKKKHRRSITRRKTTVES